MGLQLDVSAVAPGGSSVVRVTSGVNALLKCLDSTLNNHILVRIIIRVTLERLLGKKLGILVVSIVVVSSW